MAGGASTRLSAFDLAGSRISVKDGTTLGYLVPDLLGSVVATEASGSTAIASALRYDGYGRTAALAMPGGTVTLDHRFTGALDRSPDATALYDIGARFYSPASGAWTQLDTYGGQAQDPVSMNRFLYAHANPTTFIDPTGHGVDCQMGQTCSDAERASDQQRWQKYEQRRSGNRGGDGGGGSGGGQVYRPDPGDDIATQDERWPGFDPQFASPWTEFNQLMGLCEDPLHPGNGCPPFSRDAVDAALAEVAEHQKHALEWTVIGVAAGALTMVGCAATGVVGCVVITISAAVLVNVPSEYAGEYALGNIAGAGLVAGAGALASSATRVTASNTTSLVDQTAVTHLTQDLFVDRTAPGLLATTRSIGGSSVQNADLQARILQLRRLGATDIRVNQQQVNAVGRRVGVNRPDLQYTLDKQRYYEEFDTVFSNRGLDHQARLYTNDPNGIVYLWISP